MIWQKIDWWSEKISLRKRHLNRMYMDNDKPHEEGLRSIPSQRTASIKALRGNNIYIKGLVKMRLRWSKGDPL